MGAIERNLRESGKRVRGKVQTPDDWRDATVTVGEGGWSPHGEFFYDLQVHDGVRQRVIVRMTRDQARELAIWITEAGTDE